ncbi:MAG: class I SAM-dependent rRNA methyltransferase [Oscillospiraceae bacterium]|nr:class I SAM-dependent rRNA methyltransferase [Oscillospiraceae bacterium]
MKTERSFAKAIVSSKGMRWSETGHPWIYESDVENVDPTARDGEIVDAVSVNGKYLGSGFLNRHSKIRIRLLSRNANDRFDDAFWERRIRYAWDYRKQTMGSDSSCCRVIFGESDGFPGLTVDRFESILVAQTLSLGIENEKARIFPLLVKVLREDGQEICGIYERNDVLLREQEGLPQGKGWYELPGEQHPDMTKTTICENGILYTVDFENGQKTGFFLDQKYNRLALSRIAKGRTVLDCFTHTGSFALNAAKGGAKKVTAVDISAAALEAARENAFRNSLSEQVEFIEADVFEFLTELEKKGGHPYDLIILDPPAFTKSRRTAANAERGYKEINYRALKLLPRGGWLATCSCSHFMPSEQFVKMLHSAAADAKVSLMQVEARQQAPDHPILWNVPETDYLKFYLFRVV